MLDVLFTILEGRQHIIQWETLSKCKQKRNFEERKQILANGIYIGVYICTRTYIYNIYRPLFGTCQSVDIQVQPLPLTWVTALD